MINGLSIEFVFTTEATSKEDLNKLIKMMQHNSGSLKLAFTTETEEIVSRIGKGYIKSIEPF